MLIIRDVIIYFDENDIIINNKQLVISYL